MCVYIYIYIYIYMERLCDLCVCGKVSYGFEDVLKETHVKLFCMLCMFEEVLRTLL